MFPKSTFEIVVDEEILYFKDVWDYMDSGIRGDIISSSEQLDLEWDENIENVTTKSDDNLWISYKVPYIKHCWDGLKVMQKLSDMNDDYCSRMKRNEERMEAAKIKLRAKQKKKVINLGRKQYENNAAYRIKVETLFKYAILSKHLHHSMFLNPIYNNFKLGLYLSCFALSIMIEWTTRTRLAPSCSELTA